MQISVSTADRKAGCGGKANRRRRAFSLDLKAISWLDDVTDRGREFQNFVSVLLLGYV